VGAVHGLAGSGALTALVVATLPSTTTRLGYLTLFGIGSTLGMVALSGLLGWQIARMGSDRAVVRTFSLAVGCVSTVLGGSVNRKRHAAEAADRHLAQAERAAEAGRLVDENSEKRRRLLLLEQQAAPLAREAVDLTFRASGRSGTRRTAPWAQRTSNMPEPYGLPSEKYWTSAPSRATLTHTG
jgi:hypothetical protein